MTLVLKEAFPKLNYVVQDIDKTITASEDVRLSFEFSYYVLFTLFPLVSTGENTVQKLLKVAKSNYKVYFENWRSRE